MGFVELMRSFLAWGPKVRLIALPENLGFGGGSNEGFEHAKRDQRIYL